MPACQKCWRDAGRKAEIHHTSKAYEYGLLIEDRDREGVPCTPEQQAGSDASECPRCHRNTIHEIIGDCTVCGP